MELRGRLGSLWSKWAMKAGYWGLMIKAKDSWGAWSRAVVLGQENGRTCVRYRDSYPSHDRCLTPEDLRIPKAGKAKAAKTKS